MVERCGGQPIMILVLQHSFGILLGRPVVDGSMGRLWADSPRWWAIRPGQPVGAGTYAVAMPGDKEAGARTWGLMGVPSSVAAHWPGIEQSVPLAGVVDFAHQ